MSGWIWVHGRDDLRVVRVASELMASPVRYDAALVLSIATINSFPEIEDAHKKKPAVLTGGLSKEAWSRLDLLDDRIGEAVVDRFLGGHIEVAIGVLLDLFELLARAFCEDRVELVA